MCRGAVAGLRPDFESGHPFLARTPVTLTPLNNLNGAKAVTIRTESNGSFFFGTPAGVYLLSLQREGLRHLSLRREVRHLPRRPDVPERR